MQKRRFNNRGVSLVEILGILALSSIIFVSISSLLRFNVRQNAIAQEKLVNYAVADGVLNYVQSIEYKKIYTDVYGENPAFTPGLVAYTVFDKDTCANFYNSNSEVLRLENCQFSLSPEINNIKYEKRLKVVIVPFYRYTVIQNIIEDEFFLREIADSEKILNYLYDISKDYTNDPNIDPEKENILRVIVLVESNINDHYDFLLEGVITNEEDIEK
jgi:hypothetical protein